jgi:hypothetical protein
VKRFSVTGAKHDSCLPLRSSGLVVGTCSMRRLWHSRWPQIPRNLNRSPTTWPRYSQKIRSFDVTICQRFARAQLALNHRDGAKAIDTLRDASLYELMTPANPTLLLEMYPVSSAAKRTYRHIRAAKQRLNSRKFSSIAAL